MQSPARPAHALLLPLLPLLLLALAPAALAAPKKLPPSMPLCKKADPQLNECLKRSIQASFPDLVKGLSDIAVPSIDPLHVQKLQLVNGQGAVSVKLTLIDFDLMGIGDAEVQRVEMDTSRPHIMGEVTIPVLRIVGQYSGEGKVLLLPASGEGAANISLENTRYRVECEGVFVEKNNRRHWDVKKMEITAYPGHLTLQFDNLFKGDKTLSKQMNQFLNENSADIFAELKEPLEQTFAQALQHIAHRLFAKVPFDDIFLD